LDPQVPSNVELNYAGVALAVVSTAFYAFVKTNVSDSNENKGNVFVELEMAREGEAKNLTPSERSETRKKDIFDRLGSVQQRVLGIALAALAGMIYGQAFTPILYMGLQDNNVVYLDYYFSCYTGALLSAIVYFVAYCVYKKNRPVMYSNLVLPGLASGTFSAHK
jgi:hypothetical protein